MKKDLELKEKFALLYGPSHKKEAEEAKRILRKDGFNFYAKELDGFNEPELLTGPYFYKGIGPIRKFVEEGRGKKHPIRARLKKLFHR